MYQNKKSRLKKIGVIAGVLLLCLSILAVAAIAKPSSSYMPFVSEKQSLSIPKIESWSDNLFLSLAQTVGNEYVGGVILTKNGNCSFTANGVPSYNEFRGHVFDDSFVLQPGTYQLFLYNANGDLADFGKDGVVIGLYRLNSGVPLVQYPSESEFTLEEETELYTLTGFSVDVVQENAIFYPVLLRLS